MFRPWLEKTGSATNAEPVLFWGCFAPGAAKQPFSAKIDGLGQAAPQVSKVRSKPGGRRERCAPLS